MTTSMFQLLLLVSHLSFNAPAHGGSDPVVAGCRFDAGRAAVRYAVTSFGAEGVGDDLYVFSGHVGRTHAHSQANLDPHFIRYGCDGTVDELPSGGALQGTALVAFGRDVIAVGGLSARNPTANEPEDLVSVATVRRFDAESGSWVDLPDLPQPRSSHDAVVLDGKLYVVGGWQLRGKDQDPIWVSNMAILDLRTEEPNWQTVSQPFRTRALAVTHDGSRLVVAGGMTDDEQTTSASHLYEIDSGRWHAGPDLPAQRGLKGFGLAAESFDDQALFSPADGSVYALVRTTETWTWSVVATLDEPRFFHELAVVGGTLHAVAGTSRRSHLDSVEAIDLPTIEGVDHRGGADHGAAAVWAGFRHAAEAPGPIASALSEQWRAELPGYGQSSPVHWSHEGGVGRVYLTTTEGAELETQHLLSFDLASGDTIWQRSIQSTERFENSDMIARAASTPAVDAERVYALFGSGDLIATDHDGQVLWSRDLATDYGSFGGNHGVGSSVVRTADAVVVSIARKTYAYVLAVDPATGATRWKTDRLAGPGWTTPVPLRHDTLLVGGTGRLDALDAATGELLWTVDGLGGNNVSSPTVRWLTQGDHGERFQIAVAATRTGGVSVLSGTDPRQTPGLLWQNDQSSHYSAPVFSGSSSEGSCLLTSNGVGALFCFDPSTGDERWRERLAGPVWATTVEGTDDSLLVGSEKGTLQRLTLEGQKLTQQSLASLDVDGRVYGIAQAGEWVVLRSGSTLIGLSSDPTP